MLNVISRRWWILLLRGICAIVLGILAIAIPGVTLVSLVWVFGVFTIADGIAAVALGMRGEADGTLWWSMVFLGAGNYCRYRDRRHGRFVADDDAHRPGDGDWCHRNHARFVRDQRGDLAPQVDRRRMGAWPVGLVVDRIWYPRHRPSGRWHCRDWHFDWGVFAHRGYSRRRTIVAIAQHSTPPGGSYMIRIRSTSLRREQRKNHDKEQTR